MGVEAATAQMSDGWRRAAATPVHSGKVQSAGKVEAPDQSLRKRNSLSNRGLKHPQVVTTQAARDVAMFMKNCDRLRRMKLRNSLGTRRMPAERAEGWG